MKVHARMMEYFNTLQDSVRSAWLNLGLLAVLVLEFVLMSLLGIFFFFLDNMILARMNPAAAFAGSPQGFVNELLNPATITVMLTILLVQGVFLAFVDSLFKAGFFGMAKNTLQKGKTGLGEFLPEMKRFWKSMFGFQLLRYAIIGFFAVPLAISGIWLMGATYELISPEQVLFLITGVAILGMVWILVTFFFIYGEAAIVFERESVFGALKRTLHLVRENIWFTVKIVLVLVLILLTAGIIESALTMPFEYLASHTESWVIVADVTNLVFGLISMFATVVAALFVFTGYREIAG